MPRVNLPVAQVSSAGVAVAEVNSDAANDHVFVNDGATILFVRSTDAGAQDVTVQVTKDIDGLVLPDLVVSIPAGGTKIIGPFSSGIFSQQTGADVGKVYVDVAVGTLRFMALKVPNT